METGWGNRRQTSTPLPCPFIPWPQCHTLCYLRAGMKIGGNSLKLKFLFPTVKSQYTKLDLKYWEIKTNFPLRISHSELTNNQKLIKWGPIVCVFSDHTEELYRGINKSENGYQPRTNLIKDENGDLLADSYNILSRQQNTCISNRVSDVRQMEIWCCTVAFCCNVSTFYSCTHCCLTCTSHWKF
jgi:hypothetical protein